MGMTKTVQAKSITTEQFLLAVDVLRAYGETPTAQSVARQLDLPVKVVCAKITKLDKQRVIEGCGCGCGSPIFDRPRPSSGS